MNRNNNIKTHRFFAFDLGATSGRSMLGTLRNGKLELKELTRFPNQIIRIHDKYYWNIYSLFEELKKGLHVIASENIAIDAIGIDTWGVDFVYVGEDGNFLGPPRSYRDPYTNEVLEEYFKLISRREVYNLTGIQILNFNSLFQLFAAKTENSVALHNAWQLLFIPDALSYLLTDEKVCEYTIASTSQLLNPYTKSIDGKLLDVIDLSPSIVPPIVMPGHIVGHLKDSVARECGLPEVPVIAVAGHDTASAVVAVPAEDKNFAYLSSGTWSLMGVELDEPIVSNESFRMNFTNEGGADGTIRFLKNITGMWLLEQCRKEWEQLGRTYSYAEIVSMYDSIEPFRWIVNPDDSSFSNPESMLAAIVDFCRNTNQKEPHTDAEFIRCIFDSLALKYRYVLECLQQVAPFPIEKLHVIGGGAQNKVLNQIIANVINKLVIAGPSEATAIGNIMIQAKGIGIVSSLQEIRDIVRNSITQDVFQPQHMESVDAAYEQLLSYIQIPQELEHVNL